DRTVRLVSAASERFVERTKPTEQRLIPTLLRQVLSEHLSCSRTDILTALLSTPHTVAEGERGERADHRFVGSGCAGSPPLFMRTRNLARCDELGMAQTPLRFRNSPFNRFGVRMNKKLETSRDRLTREEERRLLRAAWTTMNTQEHQFVGPLLHDRLIGVLE